MTNVLDFFIRLTVRKGEAGLPPRQMRENLLAEHMGPAMLAKLYQANRARKRRSSDL